MNKFVTFTSLLKSGLFLLAMLFVAGCSGSTTDTGSATAKIVWQEAANGSATKAAAPAGVATVRVIVSGSGISPDMQQDYAATTGSGSISGIPAGTNRTFTFQGLTAGNSITHQTVVNGITINAGQNTNLGTITMLVAVAPAAPANLKVTVSTTKANLSWTDSDQLETGFVIERKTGAGGNWAEIATPAANATSYSDTGLTSSTTYYYRIKATNSEGDSAWSSEAKALTATIQLAKTGQTKCYENAGSGEIDCEGTGQDGELQKGEAWPNPRFTDNGDGTVTDNLTELVWLQNAKCITWKTWAEALTEANSLANGVCGLTDGSVVGDWRLPNRKELMSLVDWSRTGPALPAEHPFSGDLSFGYYWSSSTYAVLKDYAWYLSIGTGGSSYDAKSEDYYMYVWPVRDKQ